MKLRKTVSLLASLAVAASLMLTGCGGTGTQTTDSGTTTAGTTTAGTTTAGGNDAADTTTQADSGTNESGDDGSMSGMTATELIKAMGNGINLGNTLEAYGHGNYVNGMDPTASETLWGQPVTTQEMINGMKDLGFDSLRIPVAWTNGMNFEEKDYTIDERLMNRVEEVVNYALNADMYVIINDHWDGGWWGMFGSPDEAVRAEAMVMYKEMWTQIAERFKDYSDKLIFESANEELGDRLNDKDITGTQGTLNQNECYETANMINSEFVKLIRSTGGNNAERFLLIAGYNTDVGMTCDDRFKMPEDTAKDKLILSVHYYTPWDYCGTEGVNQWGSPDDVEEQNRLFESLTKFTDKGYGVIIGEYAVMGKNKEDKVSFYNNLLDNCDLYNYCPMLWDCSDLYRRASGTVSEEDVADVFRNRRRSTEAGKDYADIQKAARENLDKTIEASNERFMEGVSLPASDDKAIAWIMYQSNDYSAAYSVGDSYDPTNMTLGIKATNVEITGEGTYTVALDFTGIGGAKGVAFSALGISNGETFFPGYIVTIDEIRINGEARALKAKEYTSSDDGKCTRVNLHNAWVSKVPDDARRVDGDLSGASASVLDLGKKENMDTLEITFTFTAP